jgi:predicted ester cyclase
METSMTQCRVLQFTLLTVVMMSLPFVACAPAQKDDVVTKNLASYTATWDRVINRGEINLLDSAYAPSIVLHTKPAEIHGIDSAKRYYANFVTGFSNRQFTLKDIFGQGDKLVKYWRFTGIHTGLFFGIPATNRSVDVEGTTIARMIDGRIVEEQDFFDNLEFMQQLGLVPR